MSLGDGVSGSLLTNHRLVATINNINTKKH